MPEDGQSKFSKPQSDDEYFANLTRAVFIVGFSRKVINSKWDGFMEVFENFKIENVALWGDKQILDAGESTKIIRNSRKIAATVYNAQKLLTIKEDFGSIHEYLRSLDELSHEKRLKELSKQFKWLGNTAANIFLYLSGEQVKPMNH